MFDSLPDDIKDFFKDKETPIGKFDSSTIDYASLNRKSQTPYVELTKLNFNAESAFGEYEKSKIEFFKHPRGDQNKGWYGHTLFGWGENNTLHYLENKDLKREPTWSESIGFFPYIKRFVESLPYDSLFDVRLLLIQSGGYIAPHKDFNSMRLDPLNIAIRYPDDCFFKIENFGYIPYQSGKGFVVNIGYKHSVVNLSNQDRLHLVIHGKKSKDFYQVLA